MGAYGLLQALYGVTCAELFRLPDEVYSGVPDRTLDLFGLMTDNHEDPLRRRVRQGGINDMLQQRFAADLMQHFGAFRFEPRALARGQDCDGGTDHFLHPIIVSQAGRNTGGTNSGYHNVFSVPANPRPDR